MAKMFATKKEKIKVPTCQLVTGKANGQNYTLERNETVNRFSLKNEDGLILSGSFHDCMYKAEQHEVEWDEMPKLEFVEKT